MSRQNNPSYEELVTQVAEQKKRIEDLEKFEDAFMEAPDAMAIMDEQGRLQFVNKRLCEGLGYTKDELLKVDPADLKPEDTKLEYRQKYELLQKTGHLSRESTYVHNNGQVLPVELEAAVVQGKNSTFSLVIARDISQRKRKEETLRRYENELRDHNEQLMALINASPDIICFKDGKGRWLLANETDLQLFQLTGVDYKGKTDAQLAEYGEFYREAFLACMVSDEEAWKKGELSKGKETIPMPGGTDKIYDIVKVPLFQPDGTRKGLVVLGHDITDLLKTEERLRQEIVARQQDSEVLQEKSKETEEANIALRVLLNQQNTITEEMQQQILSQLKKAVFPYINLLHQCLMEDKGKEYLDIISNHLHAVGASFIKKLSNPDLGLTKREILVADLVRQGKSSKEIGKLLNLQPRSVETYRNNIRKKLQLNNKKIPLKQYLSVTFTSEG